LIKKAGQLQTALLLYPQYALFERIYIWTIHKKEEGHTKELREIGKNLLKTKKQRKKDSNIYTETPAKSIDNVGGA